MKSVGILNIASIATALGCFAFLAVTANAATQGSKIITAFDDESLITDWVSVNDTVMGGISKGEFEITTRGTLVFSGNLSLENNGGFTSIRSKPTDLALDRYDTIAVRLKGDGRTYSLDLRTRATQRASSYRSEFKTEDGIWQEIRVPFKNFEYTSFGRRVPGRGPIKADAVSAVGFTLAEKRPGLFSLEVDWIRAERTLDATTMRTSSTGDLVATAAAAGQFKTLLAAAKAAGLVEALQGDGPITVFAPTDDAFAKLPAGTVESLLKPANRDKLIAILTYHAVPGEVRLGTQTPQTIEGNTLSIAPGATTVNGAKVLASNIEASNGLIHVIDTVLMPPASPETPQQSALDIIDLAIERGVPMFNGGNAAACAAIYEVALNSLLQGHEDAMGDDERDVIRMALRKVRDRAHDHHRNAWTLRHALDHVSASLTNS